MTTTVAGVDILWFLRGGGLKSSSLSEGSKEAALYDADGPTAVEASLRGGTVGGSGRRASLNVEWSRYAGRGKGSGSRTIGDASGCAGKDTLGAERPAGWAEVLALRACPEGREAEERSEGSEGALTTRGSNGWRMGVLEREVEDLGMERASVGGEVA